ncbi:hypothetical protein BDV95DRAFT_561453 [Massariosphaeria phaeospora]|uniref:Deacetylase LmbE-like domain-containing protein n=1 Tax=Massariosphaeria phaeospora TaxID=100035 RepID=A0A7C8MC81_9PLEO|nr:hypothetical protein BDV95DRAFT_561453 [Massariosphaeria phaeospora]
MSLSRGTASTNRLSGSIYFSAHPADSLLFQTPDLYHDLYVYKCVTTVFFTSGDRGITGNSSQSLERGVENAYSYLAERTIDETAWKESRLLVDNNSILIRALKYAPYVQNVYLRLPNGAPDGQGYTAHGGESLKKLYTKKIKNVTAIDNSATYTLESLKDLIATVIRQRLAQDVRVLDYKTPIPHDNADPNEYDHADHSISARIVVDVMEQEKLMGALRGYAGHLMRTLEPNLHAPQADHDIKSDALLHYSIYDKHMCKRFKRCVSRAKQTTTEDVLDNDAKHVMTWLQREYYVR